MKPTAWREGIETAPAPAAGEAPSIAGSLVAGRFEIIGLLGAGGMATVYRARDRQLDEVVALKVMSRELVSDAIAIERFRREVKLARRVTHRNVARSFDIGEHEGQLFLTMELVEGESLFERLSRVGRLTEESAVAIARDVCAGLEAAHAAGVVHRDLKPANVLLALDGRTVLTDFGVASAILDAERNSRTVGVVVGTPEYISPEQIEGGRDLDGRADLYALGTMLFELVTGTPAWDGETMLATVMARMSMPPPDPRSRAAVSDGLAAMILACMARSRDDRPRSAAEVSERLGAIRLLEDPPAPSALRAAARGGIAVVARGASSSDNTVADGLSDLVERHLRGGTTVRVVAVPPSVRALEPAVTVPALCAAFWLEAIVSVDDLRMVVETKLARADDQTTIAVNRYDVLRAELFAVAARIARDVADCLTARLRPTLPSGPTDPKTIELWLQARVEAAHGTASARDQAVVLLEQATTRTPDEPWILSSYAATLVARFRVSGTSSNDLRESEAMAEGVVRGSELFGEAWLARAVSRFELGRPVEAAHDLGRARRTMPALAQVHALLGRFFLDVAESRRAEHHLARAILLDRSVVEAQIDRVELAMLERDASAVSRAIAVAQQHEDALDAWLLAARSCLWFDDAASARSLAAALRRKTPLAWDDRIHAVLAAVEGRNVAEALALFAWLAESDPAAARRTSTQRRIEAEIAAFHGDLPRALDALEAATEAAGFCAIAWVDGCVLLDPVRGSPRFKTLRARVETTARVVREAMVGSDFEDD